ncbi:MAG: PQQ-like protein [Conexibacter sp.]|nr:PQQ-like protein [Conexibacter sp.]
MALVIGFLALTAVTASAASAATLVGTAGIRPVTDQNSPGTAEAFRTRAVGTGTVDSITVYVNGTSTATKLVAALYADGAGGTHPGGLLTQGSTASPTASAYVDVTVPSINVTNGTWYWIAILGPTGTLTFRDQNNAGRSETHKVGGLSSMPTTWQTGSTYSDGNLSAYASSSASPAPPVLAVAPTSLSFTATTGGLDPLSKTAAVSNTGGGTLNFTTSAGASWLGVAPASGTAPANVTVAPHIAGLTAGTYDSTVTVASSGTSGSPATIAVHLTVTDPSPPALAVTPTTLSFTATTGGADPASKSAAISNTGSGTLNFTTSAGAAWLGVSPASGSAPANVIVTPHISGLAAGTYDSSVTVTAAGATGSPGTVAVHLTVSDPAPPPAADAGDWLQVDHDAERTGFAPGETKIGPNEAKTLGQDWATALDGKITAQPLYVGGVVSGGKTRNLVISATSGASVYALDADTGAILWRRNFGTPPANCAIPGGYGIVAPPAIDKARSRIYTVTEDGVLRTLTLGDGTDAAAGVPIITDPVTNRVWGGPTLTRTTLYVSTASDGCDSPPWRGRILKVDVSGASPSLAKQWDVVPGIAAPSGGGGIWGYGGVAADTATGNVYAATGADSVEAYTQYADRLVALSSNLDVLGSIEPFHPTSYPCGGAPCDVDFGATPVVFKPTGCSTMVASGNKNGILYVSKTTTLAASGAPEQTIQLNPANDWLGSGGIGGVPAWWPEGQMLFVSDVGDGWNGVAGGVVGLKVNANCTLSVAWSKTLGGGSNPDSTPTVANGVVYVGEGNTGRLVAYDATSGEQLYVSAGGGAGYAAPIVANGTVYQGTWNGFSPSSTGTIRAFKAGASPPPPPPSGVLLGDQAIESSQDQNALGSAEAFQSTATAGGSLTKMSLYLDPASTAAKVTIGVYTDTGATKPGTLLTQGSSTTVNAGAWNTITVPSTTIASGTKYWIAILGTQSGTIRFRDVAGGCRSETSSSSALTALPATWTTGVKYSDCPLSAYGLAG